VRQLAFSPDGALLASAGKDGVLTVYGVAGVAAPAARAAAEPAGVTPLMMAAQAGDVRAVERLVAAGGDLDAADELGRTALMRAAARGSEEIVRLLLDAGADPTLADRRGHTALELSKAYDQVNAILLGATLRHGLGAGKPAGTPGPAAPTPPAAGGPPAQPAPAPVALTPFEHFPVKDGTAAFDGGTAGLFSFHTLATAPARFTARVRVRWDGGTPHGCGIVFRAAPDNRGLSSFEAAPSGHVRLGKFSAGAFAFPVDWQRTDAVRPGWNELAVTVEGATITGAINGRPVLTLQDAAPAGELLVGIGANGGARCSFTDFRLGAP
jgi:hypothetical protein